MESEPLVCFENNLAYETLCIEATEYALSEKWKLIQVINLEDNIVYVKYFW